MTNPKIVLLTANIGSYDRDPFKVSPGWEKVYQITFVSSNASVQGIKQYGNSLAISLQSKPDQCRDTSRIIKINPLFLFDNNYKSASLFPDYKGVNNAIKGLVGENWDYLVWHDANCLLHDHGTLVQLCAQVPENGWGIFEHPDRNCLYKEAKAVRGFPYVNRTLLHQQISFYKSRKMPVNYGLYACNFFIRSFKALYSSQLLWDSWLAEYLRWVPRDQISLPYCLFQHPLHRPVSLGKFTWANKFFAFKPH